MHKHTFSYIFQAVFPPELLIWTEKQNKVFTSFIPALSQWKKLSALDPLTVLLFSFLFFSLQDVTHVGCDDDYFHISKRQCKVDTIGK